MWKGDQEQQTFAPNKRHKEVGNKKPTRQYSSPQSKRISTYQDTSYINAAPAIREQFTTLTVMYKMVWKENKSIIPDPPARKFSPSKLTMEDIDKFYIYHSEATHHINNCVELNRVVEGLIREGKLQQYVSEQRHVGAIHYDTINTIYRGGDQIDHRRTKAMKQCTGIQEGREVFTFGSCNNQPISTEWKSNTFTKEEEEAIKQPHEDPFLVTA